MSLRSSIARFTAGSKGATAIEYALIAGLIALVLVPALIWVRDWQERLASQLNEKLDPAAESRALIDARSDFREPPHEARDHQ